MTMTLITIAGAVLCFLLLVYLFVALLDPERFQ
jgi:K+-transporting ATPase KdpF subunit